MAPGDHTTALWHGDGTAHRAEEFDRPVEERTPGPDLFGLEKRDRRALLDWVGEHLTQVRQSVYEQRLLHWSLEIAAVVGLAVHVSR
jgi:hypothetical protein